MNTVGQSDVTRSWRWQRMLLALLLAAVPLTAAAGMASGSSRPAAKSSVPRVLVNHTKQPASAGPFVTLLFARTQITAADGCAQDNDKVARLDTTVAPFMHSLGLTGTGTLETGKIQNKTLICTHKDDTLLGSWSDASRLADSYGWSFVSHTATYPGHIGNLPPKQQYAETCGSAAAIDAHGLPGGHGLIAYPGAQAPPQQLQAGDGARCFAWGRLYGHGGLTSYRDASTPPYWQRTAAFKGGPCHKVGAPCYTLPAVGSSRYTMPSSVIAAVRALRPGQWLTFQAYLLVKGTNPAYTQNGTRWDCSARDPALHWTNDVERYCYSDFQRILRGIAATAGVTVTDPLTVGEAFGRSGF